ncbi:dihydrolipoyl dehydrogenase [Holospora curviuscula]|uniref:Dihydrolipoyl dehydrogenase n=1 Tax=Holospora curviuscula TaxID=1082868 RepID=A0A2S5RAB9_9PROT|nr:dihydrolipoyl dehydrogenase [Holospora curviuscula]PPE04269.1 Dihydrolipoyl dehydrogenase [Holospora curviuscula]
MKYDIGIIGSGPGGYVAAIRAAQLQRSVVMIEEAQLGGVCLNWGCIPTKALLKSAQLWCDLTKVSDHGISIQGQQFDLQKMVARSRKISQTLGQGLQGLMKKHGITLVGGRAKIQECTSQSVTLQVTGHDMLSLEVSHLILATGAKPRVLPVNIPESIVWNARAAMTPDQLPERLLVVGAGAIGMEFASFYQALGVQVTVLEQGSRILPQEDSECTGLAYKIFQEQGMQFFLASELESVEIVAESIHARIVSRDGSQVYSWRGSITTDRVLIAIGVTGNTQDLGLEKTKVQVTQGHIVVSEVFQTDEPTIYAIGDVIGGPWLAHLASHQGIACVEHIISGTKRLVDPLSIPGCTYTLPPFASFGLTESKARERYDVQVGRFSFSGNGQALAQGSGPGLVKIIFEEKTGELLGAHLFGRESPELLSALLVTKGLEGTAEALSSVMLPHPTMSEMIHEAALAAQGRGLHG